MNIQDAEVSNLIILTRLVYKAIVRYVEVKRRSKTRRKSLDFGAAWSGNIHVVIDKPRK